MAVRELVSGFAAVLLLAGFSVAIIYGDKSAKLLQSGTDGFTKLVKAATLQG